jgi:predicted DCC family thiol-disulfide oxidoreductase YuxK
MVGYSVYMRKEPSLVVYFDGVCVLCDSSVDFIIRHDPDALIYFASLQSAQGQTALAQLGMSLDQLDSIILQEGTRYSVKSTAVLRIAARLSGPVRWLAYLRVVPVWIRDPLYAWIAKNRYRWFGRKEVCRMPTESDRARFID